MTGLVQQALVLWTLGRYLEFKEPIIFFKKNRLIVRKYKWIGLRSVDPHSMTFNGCLVQKPAPHQSSSTNGSEYFWSYTHVTHVICYSFLSRSIYFPKEGGGEWRPFSPLMKTQEGCPKWRGKIQSLSLNVYFSKVPLAKIFKCLFSKPTFSYRFFWVSSTIKIPSIRPNSQIFTYLEVLEHKHRWHILYHRSKKSAFSHCLFSQPVVFCGFPVLEPPPPSATDYWWPGPTRADQGTNMAEDRRCLPTSDLV